MGRRGGRRRRARRRRTALSASFAAQPRCSPHEIDADRRLDARPGRPRRARPPRAPGALPRRQRRRRPRVPKQGRAGPRGLQEGLRQAHPALVRQAAQAQDEAPEAARALPLPPHPGRRRQGPQRRDRARDAGRLPGGAEPARARARPQVRRGLRGDRQLAARLRRGGPGWRREGRQLRVPAQVPERPEPDRRSSATAPTRTGSATPSATSRSRAWAAAGPTS